MFNRAFRYLCYKIYYLGRLEHRIRIAGIKRASYNQIAMLHPDAVVVGNGNIINLNKSREMVIVGRYTNIHGELLIMKAGGKIVIGEYCHIGPGTRIWSGKNIHIGNRVFISYNVNIHDNISHPLDAGERHRDFLHLYCGGPVVESDLRGEDVVIGDDVWIGFNVTILKGVKIGKGAVIGSGAVIAKDVPDYSVVICPTSQQIVKYLQ